MNLQELKQKSPADLLAYAEDLEIENASSLRKQDMMFAILKQLAQPPVYPAWPSSLPGEARARPGGVP